MKTKKENCNWPSCIKIDCFANKKGQCSILTGGCGEGCKFYKAKERKK